MKTTRKLLIIPILGLVVSACSLFTQTPSDGGVRISVDEGVTWTVAGDLGPNLFMAQRDIIGLTTDPKGRMWIESGAVGPWWTADGGKTWTNELTSSSPIQDIAFSGINGERLLVAPGTGLYIKDSTAEQWRYVTFDDRPIVGVAAWDDDRIVAFSGTGEVRISRDGGSTWTLNRTAEFTAVTKVFADRSNAIAVLNTNSLLSISYDRGETWKTIDLNNKNIPSATTVLVARNEIWLGTTGGIFFSALSDGEQWRQLPSLVAEQNGPIKAIATPRENEIIYSTGNRLYITKDFGGTWTVSQVSTTREITSLLIVPRTQAGTSDTWYIGLYTLGKKSPLL